MGEFFEVLRRPEDGTAVGQAWFAQVAARLLNEVAFVIGGEPHRLREVEFYYHGGDHEDPFAHCDPIQKTAQRWYFHRDGGQYRGGSFKGLDITFGPEGVFGGVLIRTIADASGREVNGCSLCVDHMLARTGHGRVEALDAAVDGRSVSDVSSPLHLRPLEAGAPRAPVVATARVGLTLKRMGANHEMPRYIMRRYRFLTDPQIKKGKVHTVIALHQAGADVEAIRAATRSPRKAIEGYIEAYEAGEARADFKAFRGRALKTRDLCELHGVWARAFGALERE